MQKILVLQTAFVGDLLLSIPLITRLKTIYKGAQVDLWCRKGLGSILQDLHLVDSVFEIEKAKGKKRIDPTLFDRKYDLLVAPHQSLRTAWVASRVQAAKKVGYKKWWNFGVFHKRVPRPMNYPEALRQLALIEDLDDEIRDFFQYNEIDFRFMSEGEVPRFASMTCDVEMGIAKWTELFQKPVCFLAPGSVWATKRWSVEGFSRLARHFRERNFEVCLLGAPGEEPVCRKVSESVEGVRDLCGQTTLTETLALLKRGRLLIANDSGAMHLAAVAGLPTVAVFGPTTLDLGYRPWQNRARVVEVDLSCRPCGKHGGHSCPLGTHDCMKKVRAENVIACAEELLQATGSL